MENANNTEAMACLLVVNNMANAFGEEPSTLEDPLVMGWLIGRSVRIKAVGKE